MRKRVTIMIMRMTMIIMIGTKIVILIIKKEIEDALLTILGHF